jgi:ectoine hydroxylase-related dioxygenase (phytanoyl-CoA dioxygenase family)
MAIASPAEFLTAIERDGWATTGPIISAATIDRVIGDLALLGAKRDDGSRRRGGVRDLLTWPAVLELACSRPVRSVAELVLGPACFAVRAILFDKTPTSNWKVIWHQDLTIAVEQRLETPGFGPWTNKGGIPHVQAPVALLERMIAIRVHLDPCGAENGPMRVLPGSHPEGRLSSDAIARWRAERAPVGPAIERGGVLAFRPLLLHASSAALVPTHRRVIHFEFAAEDLPAPLRWNTRA